MLLCFYRFLQLLRRLSKYLKVILNIIFYALNGTYTNFMVFLRCHFVYNCVLSVSKDVDN